MVVGYVAVNIMFNKEVRSIFIYYAIVILFLYQTWLALRSYNYNL